MSITNEPQMDQPIADDIEMVTFVEYLKDTAKKRKDVTICGVDYTALPLDADGVPIHEGDKMVWCATPGGYPQQSVTAITSDGFITYHKTLGTYIICRAADYRHYNNQTVGILLRNLGHDWLYSNKERTQIINSYAKRLKLADDNENQG